MTIVNKFNNAKKDLDMFEKLMRFVSGIIIKNEAEANANETTQSMENASRYVNLVSNMDIPNKSELYDYIKVAILRGFNVVVKNKVESYELLNDERLSYSGNIYIFDEYRMIDKNWLKDNGVNVALYSRNKADTHYVYSPVSITDIDKYAEIFTKNIGGKSFVSVSKEESFNHAKIYKKINTNNYIRYSYSSGTNNLFLNNTALFNKYYTYVTDTFIEIPTSEIKISSGYSYLDSGVFVPISSLRDVIENDIYYNMLPVLKQSVELVNEIYGYKEYFDIIEEEIGYYDVNDIYIEKDALYTKISSLYVTDLIEKYNDVFVKEGDNYKVSVSNGNQLYLFMFNPITETISNYSHNYDIRKKQEYCSSCYSGDLVKTIELNGDTRYKCSSCGYSIDSDTYKSFDKLYMYLSGTSLLFEFTNNQKALLTARKVIKKNSYRYNCNKIEFFRNNVNSFREINEYYLHLITQGVDLALARQLPDGSIIKYPENILTDVQIDKFISSYNTTKSYFSKMLHNEAYKIYKNYINLVNFIVLIYSIIRFIDDDLKNVMNVDSFTRRDLLNMFYSFGIYEFDNIPEEYQIAILKNIHKLLRFSGTDVVIKDILSIFNNEYVQAFRYLIIKDYDKDTDGNIIKNEYYNSEDVLSLSVTELENIMERRSNEHPEIGIYYDNIDYTEYSGRIIAKYEEKLNDDFPEANPTVSIANIKSEISTKFGLTPERYEYLINKKIEDKLQETYNSSISSKLSTFSTELKTRSELNRLHNVKSSSIFEHKTDLLTIIKTMLIDNIINSAVSATMTFDMFKTIMDNHQTSLTSINTKYAGYVKSTTLVLDKFNITYNMYKLISMIKDMNSYSLQVMFDKYGITYDSTKSLTEEKQLFIDTLISRLSLNFSINSDYLTWLNVIINNTNMIDIYNYFFKE